MTAILAFDTATDRIHLGLAFGGRTWSEDHAGGAHAGATLVPAVLALLARAGVALRDLDAIAFGRGPGAFTGLRTACAVAQGLALGAARPVLPIDTLLAVAEDARGDAEACCVWAMTDARMDQIYAAQYRFEAGAWQELEAPQLTDADALSRRWAAAEPAWVAGNALDVFGARLAVGHAVCCATARPRAGALLRLAVSQWQRGGAVDAADALPLYVRDKVAQTTAERDAARAAAGAGAVSGGGASASAKAGTR